MRHELSALAEAEIGALRDEGVTVTDADVVRLNDLAWMVETPESRRLLSRGVPVEIGGVTLWPLTLYASEWYDRVGVALRDPGAALAYAMACGYTEGALDCEGREAARRVKAWRRGLRCTRTAIETAIAQVQDQDRMPDQPEDPDAPASLTPGDFSAHLASAVGGDPAFWERRCAFGYALAVLKAIAAQNRADGESNAHDARLWADRALGLEIERIKERHHGAA